MRRITSSQIPAKLTTIPPAGSTPTGRQKKGRASPAFFSPSTHAPLVGVHAGLLDDRCPLIDLRFEMRAQRLGRSALLRHRLRAKIGETTLDGLLLDRGLTRSG